MPPPFVLQGDVHANIAELRRALGSALRPLSYGDLARMVNERKPPKPLNSTKLQRWEKEGVEPDYHAARLMAQLAGVTYEAFTLGARYAASGQPQSYQGPGKGKTLDEVEAELGFTKPAAEPVPAPRRRKANER